MNGFFQGNLLPPLVLIIDTLSGIPFPSLLSLVSGTVSMLFGFSQPLRISLVPCSTHGFREIISSDQTVFGPL